MFTNESDPNYGWSDLNWWSNKQQSKVNSFSESSWSRAAAYTPAMTVWENSNSFFVTCELPGVYEKDAEIIWHNGTLVIRGQKFSRAPDHCARTCASDQWNGHFYRVINMQQVAASVDTSQISSRWINGVLEVALPKSRSFGECFKIG